MGKNGEQEQVRQDPVRSKVDQEVGARYRRKVDRQNAAMAHNIGADRISDPQENPRDAHQGNGKHARHDSLHQKHPRDQTT